MTTITHFSLPPPSAPSLLILSPPTSAQPLTYLQSTLKSLKNLAFPTKVQISEVHCNKLYVLEESIGETEPDCACGSDELAKSAY